MDPAFRELLADFLSEGTERTDTVEQLLLRLEREDSATRIETLNTVRRELHTLKGNAGMMGLETLRALAHQLEDGVEALDTEDAQGLTMAVEQLLSGVDQMRAALVSLSAPGADSNEVEGAGETADGAGGAPVSESSATDGRIRVSYRKIDELVELQAEALVLRNRLAESIRHGRSAAAEHDEDQDPWIAVTEALRSLEKSLDRLQDRIIDLDMVPLEGLFHPLARIVHDESRKEGKKVELRVLGGETPIDKALLEIAGDALGHLVRNAIIHGIETPEAREKRGKPAAGTVVIDASVVSSEVRIEVRDDGAGVDRVALGIGAEHEGEGNTSPGLEKVFESGVTSRGDADLSAGRGVGLSAVRAGVERAGGRVEVWSEPGQGSAFALHLPLTTTILRSLLLSSDDETYALPLGAVTESLRLDPRTLHQINQAGVLRWRGKIVPLLDLGQAFLTTRRPRREGFAIVIETGNRARALVVDSISGIRDIVVKSLDPIVGQPVGISGSTILGDGRVIMILDPVTLAALPPTSGQAT